MKNLRRFLFGVILLLFISITSFSCASRKPLEKVPANNNETYEVEYLFEHEGCKVYRFRDDGNYVYFTNCKGDVTSFGNDSIKTRVTNRINQ